MVCSLRVFRVFLVLLAGFSVLIISAKEGKSSPGNGLVIDSSKQGAEDDKMFRDVSAHHEQSDQPKRRKKRSWWWGSRRRRRSFVVRPHCEHETHAHFYTRCCSGKFIDDPLLQTCCAGRIVAKNMVPFYCHPWYGCGCFWYDSNRQKCCYGNRNLGCKDVQPVCGLVRYNPSTQRCCDGRYTYVITTQTCCHRRVISRSSTCRI